MDFDIGGYDDIFNTLMNDPVVNDRMISDAVQPNPQVQSEHSYSLANSQDMLIGNEGIL